MPRKAKTQLCLASAVTPKAATAALKSAGAEIKNCVTTLLEDMEPQIKEKWNGALKSMEIALASIPEADENAEATKTVEAWTAFSAANQLVIANLQGVAADTGSKLQTTLASIPGQIESAIALKLKDGSIVTKEASAQAIADATGAASKAAHDAALVEVTRIGNHRARLRTAYWP